MVEMEQTTHLTEIRETLLETDRHTYGYGEKYPLPDDDDPVSVDDTNNKGGIYHPNEDSCHAFDLTAFGDGDAGSERFTEMLRSLGIDPVDDYHRIYRDLGRGESSDYDEAFVYVWSTDDVQIQTTNNAITGENAWGDALGSLYHGNAGYISVAGKESAVPDVVSAIREYASHVKAENPGQKHY